MATLANLAYIESVKADMKFQQVATDGLRELTLQQNLQTERLANIQSARFDESQFYDNQVVTVRSLIDNFKMFDKASSDNFDKVVDFLSSHGYLKNGEDPSEMGFHNLDAKFGDVVVETNRTFDEQAFASVQTTSQSSAAEVGVVQGNIGATQQASQFKETSINTSINLTLNAVQQSATVNEMFVTLAKNLSQI